MRVVATAGHVDHGKSTLIRRLTGIEPDRLAEEQRRGLTIDLGFAWRSLPSGEVLAFVDVPGHERFVPTMVAGVGPVPAAVFVVAADEGWMPQSAEHLAALDALGVSAGLLVVTKADLADPEPARTEALERIHRTSLGSVPAVVVSGRTGAGLDDLVAALDRLATGLSAPDPDADVRLWVDRVFTIRGAGTVVTGTLGAGRLQVGADLELAPSNRAVQVRGLQSLGTDRQSVRATARVAVNLRGVDRDEVERGDALLAPGRWSMTSCVDVALRFPGSADVELVPSSGSRSALTLHLGAAATPVRMRRLGDRHARLLLRRAVPARVADSGILRDPGRRHVVAGVTVLDIDPPTLRRHGAARQRVADLDGADPGALARLRLAERGFVAAAELTRMGLPATPEAVGSPVAGWHVAPRHWALIVDRVATTCRAWQERNPTEAGVPAATLHRLLDVPDRHVLDAVVRAAGWSMSHGLVHDPRSHANLPPTVEAAVCQVETDLESDPFVAPDAGRLAELGLGRRELAAADRAGRLRVIAEGLVLLPDALDHARQVLARLEQPFTLSQARQALGTTRRVAVPLLELFDAEMVTERLPDSTRRFRAAGPGRSGGRLAGNQSG